MADGVLVLRQRMCPCQTIFYICRSCDRGQRYCSPRCRHQARCEQRRRANRRHQQSQEGQLDHRDRQRLYRRQRAQRVTDQGSPTPDRSASMSPVSKARPPQADSAPVPESRGTVCLRCGRSGYPIACIREVVMTQHRDPLASAQSDYVKRLFKAYAELPETRPHWNDADRRLAADLFRRRIPLQVVETAFLLGSARRLARDPQRWAPPIRCLAYFLGVLEEVLAQPPPAAYIQYLRLTHLGSSRRPSTTGPEE